MACNSQASKGWTDTNSSCHIPAKHMAFGLAFELWRCKRSQESWACYTGWNAQCMTVLLHTHKIVSQWHAVQQQRSLHECFWRSHWLQSPTAYMQLGGPWWRNARESIPVTGTTTLGGCLLGLLHFAKSNSQRVSVIADLSIFSTCISSVGQE